MKNIMIVCALAFAACGGGKKPDTTTNTTTTTTDGSAAGSAAATTETPCTQELALECPEGQIDGCLKEPAEGTNHACVAK